MWFVFPVIAVHAFLEMWQELLAKAVHSNNALIILCNYLCHYDSVNIAGISQSLVVESALDHAPIAGNLNPKTVCMNPLCVVQPNL